MLANIQYDAFRLSRRVKYGIQLTHITWEKSKFKFHRCSTFYLELQNMSDWMTKTSLVRLGFRYFTLSVNGMNTTNSETRIIYGYVNETKYYLYLHRVDRFYTLSFIWQLYGDFVFTRLIAYDWTALQCLLATNLHISNTY